MSTVVCLVAAVLVALRLRPPPVTRAIDRTNRRSGSVATGLLMRARDAVRVRSAVRRRRPLVAAQAADVVDLFVLAIGSGLNVRLALEPVRDRAPPEWRVALDAVLDHADRGRRLSDALELLPALLGDSARPLVRVVADAERLGTPLLPSLQQLAVDARLERRRRAEEVARRVPVRLLFPLVLCVLPAFGLLTVAPLLAGALGSLRL